MLDHGEAGKRTHTKKEAESRRIGLREMAVVLRGQFVGEGKGETGFGTGDERVEYVRTEKVDRAGANSLK